MKRKPAHRPQGRAPLDTTFPAEIAALESQADVAAADRLLEIATGSDRGLAKAARTALHRLRLAGIAPAAAPPAPIVTPPPSTSIRVRMSSIGGTGSQMATFFLDDPYGGAQTIISFLLNDIDPVLDTLERRMSRRETAEFIEQQGEQKDSLFVEAPLDYARWRVEAAIDSAIREGKTLPQGTRELAARIGAPERSYARSLAYELVDEDLVRADPALPHDPDRLLVHPVFHGWYVDLDEFIPWIERFTEAQQSRLALDPGQLRQRGERVLSDAADALFGESGAALWRGRLEETAVVLHLAGETEAARMAVWQALDLRSGGPARDHPFIVAVVRRTMDLAMELLAEYEEQQKQQKASKRSGVIQLP